MRPLVLCPPNAEGVRQRSFSTSAGPAGLCFILLAHFQFLDGRLSWIHKMLDSGSNLGDFDLKIPHSASMG